MQQPQRDSSAKWGSFGLDRNDFDDDSNEHNETNRGNVIECCPG